MSKSDMYHVYSVINRDGRDSAIWIRVGSAFYNRDGSVNILLDVLPLNGRLNVRRPKSKKGGNDEEIS